jgi:hypothetical protein
MPTSTDAPSTWGQAINFEMLVQEGGRAHWALQNIYTSDVPLSANTIGMLEGIRSDQ